MNDVYLSSSVSFLYSLKDHAGIGPVKMPIKSNKTAGAVYHNVNFGPRFGQSDLEITTNANESASFSRSTIGGTYERPANCRSGNFLTGSSSFTTVSECEVFLV
jgi:hypothetical protein